MTFQEDAATGADISQTGDLTEVLNPAGKAVVTFVLENASNDADYELKVRDKEGTKWYTLEDSGDFATTTSQIQHREVVSAYEIKVEIVTAAASGTADYYFAVGEN